MFRTLAALILIGSVAPAAVIASGPGDTKKTNVHVTSAASTKTPQTLGGSKTTTTPKLDVTKTTPKLDVTKTTPKLDVTKTTSKGTVDAAKKFPKINTGYQPKVAKGVFDKHVPKNFDKTYHTKFGSKFDHGYCFHGKHHHHWSFCCWDSHFGCHTYWCPCTSCFYYWCEPYACFYPVTYCPCQTYVFTVTYVVPGIVVVPCEGIVPQ